MLPWQDEIDNQLIYADSYQLPRKNRIISGLVF